MNLRLQQLLKLHGLYCKPAGEAGSDTGGTGTGTNAAAKGTEGTDNGNGVDSTGGTTDPGASADGNGGAGVGATGETAKGVQDDAKPAEKQGMSDEAAKLLKDVMKQKQRAQEAEDRAKALADKFNGIDPDVARSLLAEKAERERKEAEERGEYDRLVAQMAERHKSDLEGVNAAAKSKDEAISGLQKQIADLTVGGAFVGSRFIAEETTLPVNKVRTLYGSHFEFKDGAVVGYDKPAGAADRTLLVDGQGSPLSFDEAIAEVLKKDPDYESLVRSKIKPGSGSNTASNSRGTTKAALAQQAAAHQAALTPAEKIALGAAMLRK